MTATATRPNKSTRPPSADGPVDASLCDPFGPAGSVPSDAPPPDAFAGGTVADLPAEWAGLTIAASVTRGGVHFQLEAHSADHDYAGRVEKRLVAALAERVNGSLARAAREFMERDPSAREFTAKLASRDKLAGQVQESRDRAAAADARASELARSGGDPLGAVQEASQAKADADRLAALVKEVDADLEARRRAVRTGQELAIRAELGALQEHAKVTVRAAAERALAAALGPDPSALVLAAGLANSYQGGLPDRFITVPESIGGR